MAKAPSAEQLRLLELQGLDSKIVQLKRRAAGLLKNPDIDAARARASAADSALTAANTAVADLELELKRAENDVALVVARMDKDRARLDSGTGSSKDLTALQHELESLTKRRSDLEDAELEVMERLEEARARQAESRSASEELGAALSGLETERDEEIGRLDAERAAVEARRAEFAATVDPKLLPVYEKTLAQRGIGAARLFHGKSEGSGMQLSPGDLADIKAAAEDDVVFCPDSGCILVRSPEWSS